MCFCKGWLLKIKAERCRAGRFFIDVMKRSQVWVMQSLINCTRKNVFEFIVKPPLTKWIFVKPDTCDPSAWIKHKHSLQQIYCTS
jgi:hypothetical protein